MQFIAARLLPGLCVQRHAYISAVIALADEKSRQRRRMFFIFTYISLTEFSNICYLGIICRRFILTTTIRDGHDITRTVCMDHQPSTVAARYLSAVSPLRHAARCYCVDLPRRRVPGDTDSSASVCRSNQRWDATQEPNSLYIECYRTRPAGHYVTWPIWLHI